MRHLAIGLLFSTAASVLILTSVSYADGLSGVVPGGVDNSVQTNGGGNLTGNSSFTYDYASTKHGAIGNNSVIDNWEAPHTSPGFAPMDFMFQSNYSGDLSLQYDEGVTEASTYTHTGTNPAYIYPGFYSVPEITSSSTGEIGNFFAIYGQANNYGSGTLDQLIGGNIGASNWGSAAATYIAGAVIGAQNQGTGNATDIYGIDLSTSDEYGAGLTQNMHGLNITAVEHIKGTSWDGIDIGTPYELLEGSVFGIKMTKWTSSSTAVDNFVGLALQPQAKATSNIGIWLAADGTLGSIPSGSWALYDATGLDARLSGNIVGLKTLQTKTIYSAAGTALPTCNAAAEGSRASVSDATAPTYLGTYVSGGAVRTSVYCNGTGWITL